MGNIFSVQMSCDFLIARCWNCTVGEAQYIRKLEDNLADLQTAREELRALKNDVMRRVRIKEEQQMKRLETVQHWLSCAEAATTEADELLTEGPQEIQKLCLGGYCSRNCKSSYVVGKRVTKILGDVISLKAKGDFRLVAEKEVTESVVERPSEVTVGLETMLSKVWKSLMEEQVGTVGLYGMGGVGKTTLLTQINNKFLNTPNDFDIVIWVGVSKDLRLNKVQDDIWRNLGFSDEQWKKRSLHEKTTDIFRILSRKKYVLLLDDLWERVDLIKVGVPLPSAQNGSKIVLTTRSKVVLGHMEVDRKMKVECLPWEEAWSLFQRKVGQETLNSHPDIPKLAEMVAAECKGLPLALVTIGRAMACKETPQEWNHAIQVLKSSASEFSGIENEVFQRLKFSYDSLPNDKARTCFLYVTLFPEDTQILKTELIEYWISEGFFDEYGDASRARIEGYEIIGTLLHACLLQEEDDSVKMHDTIRDMALWIAYQHEKGKQNYLVQAGAQLVEAPESKKWQGVNRMSLMANQVEKLTETPTCSELLTLFLGNNHLKMIASDFFQHMPNLRVLDLSGNHNLSQLPFGISKLVSLEHLNLMWTEIRQLPVELKALAKLRYLNLDFTYALDTIPWSVISGLSMLHILRMFECGSLQLGAENDLPSTSNEALVEQVKCLKHLEQLNMTIRNVDALQRFLSSFKLQNCARALSLQFLICSELNISFLQNMKFLEVIWIDGCNRLQELKIDTMNIKERSFNCLSRVIIGQCAALTDLSWVVLAPNLKFLEVSRCNKLEEIISVGKFREDDLLENLKPFAKLEVLILRFLPQLKSIYWSTLPFPNLKEIYVHVCPKLHMLPLSSVMEMVQKLVIQGEDRWWRELEWEDKDTQQVFLPCFRSIA